MSDIDEKVLASLPWRDDKETMLNALDTEIDELTHRVEELTQLSQRLEQLKKIRKSIETNTLHADLVNKYTNMGTNISSICGSYATGPPTLDDMLLQVYHILSPLIEYSYEVNCESQIIISLRSILLSTTRQYDPTDMFAYFGDDVIHDVVDPDKLIDENRLNADGVFYDMSEAFENVPRLFYDRWNDSGYITVVYIDGLMYIGDEPIFNSNGSWIAYQDYNYDTFVHKDNAHFVIRAKMYKYDPDESDADPDESDAEPDESDAEPNPESDIDAETYPYDTGY